jgi:hypothetical protein
MPEQFVQGRLWMVYEVGRIEFGGRSIRLLLTGDRFVVLELAQRELADKSSRHSAFRCDRGRPVEKLGRPVPLPLRSRDPDLDYWASTESLE